MSSPDLVFLHGLHTPACRARVDKHFEGYYTLQFMAHGALELCYDDRCHRLDGSWFWPAWPGPHVRFHAAPGHASWNHRYIAFHGPLATQWVADGLYPTAPQAAPDRDVAVARFDELLACFRRPDRWSQRRAVNVLERILIDLAEARQESQARTGWLERVLASLDDDATFEADYAALAAQQGMSLSSLRRKFRAATGISIHRYRVQARIARARRWLGESDLPIKLIAARLGYADVQFFCRQFHQQAGTTPALFRKSRQA
jgi:AraC-like DNA-binding protein